MSESISYRFNFEDQVLWRKHLHEEGFVVIKNWIPKEQCQNYVQQLWEIMEVLSDGKLNRNLPQTQISPENYPPVLQGGMVHYVGHSKTQWELRKKLVPLFQKLWKCEELKTSFDGFCFMNGLKNYPFSPINSFLHSDQSPTRNGLWSYQGICHLTKSGDGEGGFVVAPKSNHYHHKYFEDKGLLDLKKDWFLIPQADKSLQYLTCIKLNTQAGDFTIFDSRTFHSSTVPYEKVLRVCTYICMVPSTHIPEEVRQVRKQAAETKAVSSHQPGDGFRTFPALPCSVDADRFNILLKKVNNCHFDDDIVKLI